MKDILEYFPLPEPRPQQVRALQYVQEMVDKGYRDIALQMPTGVGKSAVGATIAAWAHENMSLDKKKDPGAYVLVHQKILQDQIERELVRFSSKQKAALIKGSIEYECPEYHRCQVGARLRCSCIGAGTCAYKQAKASFLAAQIPVTNYAYFFTERAHVGDLADRQALVCDEAHGLSRTVLRQVDVVIAEENLARFAPDIHPEDMRKIFTLADFLAWIEDDYLPSAQQQLELVSALHDSDEQMRDAYELEQHVLKVTQFLARASTDSNGWVFWIDSGSRGDRFSLVARPLNAAPFFAELVTNHIPLRVYMSAFLGDKSIFCSELGLEPSRVAWYRLSSPFKAENRRVQILDVGSMSRRNQEATLPALARVVMRLMNHHADTRGIIHTNSYRLADALVEVLVQNGLGDRIVYPQYADERDAALVQHAEREDSVLISPSVGEGFDFRGDLARFQIVVKVPYAALDVYTTARMERDPQWYQSEALKSFVQTCGRSTRSADDFSITYVLDSDIYALLRSTADHLPRWFCDALIGATGEQFFTEA